MAALNMTGRRVEVLRAIARGEVSHHRNWGHDPDSDTWASPDGRKTVTGICNDLKQAGLAQLGRAEHPSMYASRPWELTDTGRQWLAEHPED